MDDYSLTFLDDEEMYEGEYDDEMEYEEDMGEDEDNISDEDEEIEGMGPIEGLSGDHGVDVEVIMEEEDDDDEDDEGSSGDDEEHDSEDDDGRVEIIDEVGNIQQLAEEEDMGEWESDDDDHDEPDEEDYEGQAADQEEAHAHGISDVDGALGQLLRSLGGGGEGAADIIERMEAGEMDAGDEDPIAGEYMEEVDEDGT
jgi:E3 ubiquitin-protein ligase HUWE1